MAEIEIGLLGRTCLDRRIGSVGEFTDEVKAYLARKNEESKSINRQFTNEKPASNSKHPIPQFEFYATLGLNKLNGRTEPFG